MTLSFYSENIFTETFPDPVFIMFKNLGFQLNHEIPFRHLTVSVTPSNFRKRHIEFKTFNYVRLLYFLKVYTQNNYIKFTKPNEVHLFLIRFFKDLNNCFYELDVPSLYLHLYPTNVNLDLYNTLLIAPGKDITNALLKADIILQNTNYDTNFTKRISLDFDNSDKSGLV